MLHNVQAYDFRLKPGAAAIDAGQIIEGVSKKFNGKAPDLGAYELGEPGWKAGYISSARKSD